ncbi:MAG: PQQ-binding-like beta-propeller repeat protein, partial [Planctomycetes bacterium]|nr:PQQ-binding-like beta-propeller repeat protein [Planctomycetota bacterium]
MHAFGIRRPGMFAAAVLAAVAWSSAWPAPATAGKAAVSGAAGIPARPGRCARREVSLDDSSPQRLAGDIYRRSGVRGGLVVLVGCGDGRLALALRAGERYTVRALDGSASAVERARRFVRRAGLYGPVAVDPLEGRRLPYAERLVNLLVVRDAAAVDVDEVLRVLVPRGVAYIRRPAPAGGGDAKGRWVELVKPWPAGMDEWTHWLHGPDCNAVSADVIVGPPRRFQWVARPMWSRSHDSVPSVSAIVSSRGRLFYIVDEAPAGMSGSAPDKWALVARDAFNGLLLWRVPIKQWGWRCWSNHFTCRFTVPTELPRRLVAAGDKLYATLGFNAPLTELDAATGKVLRTFAGTRFTDEILCDGEHLILSLNKAPAGPTDPAGGKGSPVRKAVAVIDRRSGEMLWKRGDYVGLHSKTGSMENIGQLAPAAGGGGVYFLDHDKLICLELADGRQRWAVPRPRVPERKIRFEIRITDMCVVVYHDGLVLLAQVEPDRDADWRDFRAKLYAYSAATGKLLWSRVCAAWGWGHPPNVFCRDGLVWVFGFRNYQLMGLDPRTGDIRRQVSTRKAFNNAHHHRCYRNKATARFVITAFRGMEFIDWRTGRTDRNHWVRGTCRLGPMPANGMIYAPAHPCDCYITSKLNGMLALAPAAPAETSAPPAALASPAAGRAGPDIAADDARLVKGPAFGFRPAAGAASPGRDDWPTYRHDPRRSGSTGTVVPRNQRTVWRVELGGRLTASVVAGGSLFVARRDAMELLCLDTADGRVPSRDEQT